MDVGIFPRLLLGPDEAPINGKLAIAIKRHESPCPCDLLIVEDQRPGLELLHRDFQRAKTRVDLFGEFILALVFLFERSVFGKQLGMGRAFVIRHRRRVSAQPPQTVAVAIGQVERNLDPFPTFGRDGFGFGLKFLADQTIEQGRVFQPAAVIALEEVMQHGAAS